MFQPTHPCGVRPSTGSRRLTLSAGFNPRTPAGCDFSHIPIFNIIRSFNPRTPAGCDLCLWLPESALHLFQPTHPCGVRPQAVLGQTPCKRFQPTHPCGVRPTAQDVFLLIWPRFNPRTPAGCDNINHTNIFFFVAFQPTHPCGVRRFGWRNAYLLYRFNPRTPAGCDHED